MEFIYVPIVEDSRCLSFLYGFMLTRGVPASGGYPSLSPSIVGEFLQVEGNLDFGSPWMTESGEVPRYPRTAMRYGISSPEQFSLVEPALEQLEADLSPLQNLSQTHNRVRGDLDTAFLNADYPVTWAIPTGEPVIRFVAADSMQDDLQDTLLLGLVFCIMALWWGFREESPFSERMRELSQKTVPTSFKIVINSGCIRNCRSEQSDSGRSPNRFDRLHRPNALLHLLSEPLDDVDYVVDADAQGDRRY